MIFKIKNYHYERDSEGVELKRKPRIITSREKDEFIYKEWSDRTKPEEPINYIESEKLIRVDLGVKVAFSPQAKLSYEY